MWNIPIISPILRKLQEKSVNDFHLRKFKDDIYNTNIMFMHYNFPIYYYYNWNSKAKI